MEIRFLRDQFGREIDFVVLKNKKPLFAVECKSGEKGISKSLIYYKERTSIPAFYQIHLGKMQFTKDGISVLPFIDFCKNLDLV